MTASEVLYDVDGQVGTITLNRPDKLNAFEARMREALLEVVDVALADTSTRVVVVTGAGRAFCAGADIGYLSGLVAAGDSDAVRALIDTGGIVVSKLRASGKPIVAALNGPAAGGGANLALACDLRLASDRASIGQTFNRIGLHPDWGGTYFLPRLVGHAKALELVFTGEMVGAAEALAIGLFNRVFPHERFAEETRAFAATLAAKPPLALATAKHSINSSSHSTLAEMLERERRVQLELFCTEDACEGTSAFVAKRPAAFRGV